MTTGTNMVPCGCGRRVSNVAVRYYRVTTDTDIESGRRGYVPTRPGRDDNRGCGTRGNVTPRAWRFTKTVTVDVAVCPDCANRVTRMGRNGATVREITATDMADRAMREPRVTRDAFDRPPIIATNGRRVVVF